jgi:cobalt/nickel transport system permease protein
MILITSQESSKDSLLSQLDPRFKLANMMILAFSFSFVSDFRLLGSMIAITLVLFICSGLTVSFILRKLKAPSLIILALVAVLPFVSGESILLDLGVFTLKKEGLNSSLLMATRFLCIITMVLIILNTSSLLTYVRAMQAMGLPWVMTDMTLLVFRYLEVVKGDYTRMKTSMRLKGFTGKKLNYTNLKTFAWLCTGLLVRSLERSDWIYRSMRIRGYGSQELNRHDFKARRQDFFVLGVLIIIAAGLAGLEISLG